MKKDVRIDQDIADWTLINQDTGETIELVIWADDETGMYEQYKVDEQGNVEIDPTTNEFMTRVKTENIKLIKRKLADD